MARKDHRVQIIKDGYRWVAVELGGKVTFMRDGKDVGSARWRDDQFTESTALLPDAISQELEQLLKRAIEADYFD